MIPREILKKIRQIEIRTNRLVSETLDAVSFQPSAEFCGVLISLPEGYYFYEMLLLQNREVNRAWPPDNFCFASGWSGFGITKWVGNNLLQVCINKHGKTSANTGFPRLIPITCLAHFFADFGLQ